MQRASRTRTSGNSGGRLWGLPRSRRRAPAPSWPAGMQRDCRCALCALPDRPAAVQDRVRPIFRRWRSATSAARWAAAFAYLEGRQSADRRRSSAPDRGPSIQASLAPPNQAWEGRPRVRRSCCHPRSRRSRSRADGYRCGPALPTAARPSPWVSSTLPIWRQSCWCAPHRPAAVRPAAARAVGRCRWGSRWPPVYAADRGGVRTHSEWTAGWQRKTRARSC